jgi:hypothetical protein
MSSWEGSEPVTRGEWLSGADPLEMVNAVADGVTDRKLRLFLVACCRRLWHLPAVPGLRNAAQAAEQFADGECSQEELERAARAAHAELDSADEDQGWPWLRKAGGAVLAACLPAGYLGNPVGSFAGRYVRGSYWVMRAVDAAAEAVARHAASVTEGDRDGILEQALAGERAEQCRLLRDLVGDPFRPAELCPSWLAWNGGTVVGLAGTIYRERTFDMLPVLGDALEDAGCDDVQVLAHCRSRGPHVRGCWLLDALLGKG